MVETVDAAITDSERPARERGRQGSALQLLLNVGLLILVGAVALRAQRMIWRPRASSGPP